MKVNVVLHVDILFQSVFLPFHLRVILNYENVDEIWLSFKGLLIYLKSGTRKSAALLQLNLNSIALRTGNRPNVISEELGKK